MCRVLKCDKYRITQYYSNKHKALDMVKYYSSMCPITAHTEGTIIWLQTGQKWNGSAKPGTNATYGNCVKIKHPNGYYTLYAHMEKVYVKKGQYVSKGQEIGYMGNTGKTSSAINGGHLHFEIRTQNETRINPQPYLDADLPNMNTKYYQTYDNVKNKWLPKVRVGSSDYAGNKGNGQSGFRCDTLTYRVHDKVKGYWLPWVTGNKDYAGNLPNDFDAIQFKENVTYRVYDNVKKKFLPWVTGSKDYAGNFGNSVGAVQVK